MLDAPFQPLPFSQLDPTEAAYHASLPDIEAVPRSELIRVTLDVMGVTFTVSGVLPRLRSLRGEIDAELRRFDFERFDKLEQYSLALLHVHAWHGRQGRTKQSLVELGAEVARARDRLLGLARSLVDLGLVPAGELDRIKVAAGYRPLVGDIFTLAAVYDEHWHALAGKVPLTWQDIVETKALALQLGEGVGLAEQAARVASAPDKTGLLRQKAFTLLVRTYEQARRAVAYVRAPHGDAAVFAPSLFALRTRKRAAARARELARSTPPAHAAASIGAAPPIALLALPPALD